MHKWGNSSESFPYVITIFSAPNYCGSYNNKAAVLILKTSNLQLKQYQETEGPYRLPDGLNLFSWSIPYLLEKVTECMYSVLKQCSAKELEADIDEETVKRVIDKEEELLTKEEKKQKRISILRNKLNSIGRMNRMLTTLRENSETLLEMKKMSPDGKIPRGVLLEKKPSI